MGGDIADDAIDRAVAGVDGDALGFGDGGINAAHLFHVDVAVGIDVIDGHRDLIRMRGEHDTRRTALVEHGHAVAVGIRVGGIGELGGVIEPDALAAGFVAGGTGSVDEGFEKFQ